MSNHPFDQDPKQGATADYVPPTGYAGQNSAAPVPPAYETPVAYPAPQNPYAAPQYPPVYGQSPYGDYQPVDSRASTYATLSIVSAIVGFFLFGIILGPVAIVLGTKAEKLGATSNAKIGKVLGWITTGLSALAIVVMLLLSARSMY